jgi:hypothetical protein
LGGHIIHRQLQQGRGKRQIARSKTGRRGRRGKRQEAKGKRGTILSLVAIFQHVLVFSVENPKCDV